MNKKITSAIALALIATTSLIPQAQADSKVMLSASSAAFQTDFTSAAERTVNEVVCIKSYTSRQQQQYGGFDPFGDFFDFFGYGGRQQAPQQERRQQRGEPVQSGLGSGVIISSDGYIVTNNHVIDGADRLEVLLNDNSTFDAKVIGTDEATDLALIKIDAKGLSAITFGDSDAVKVGEWVLAVGNPFGFNSTVTAGIVSAKARSLSQGGQRKKMNIDSYIQTDAALNPGNSGGALVNLNGELIGINSAIYSNTGSFAGFSFAIPTSIVKKVVTDLKQYGTVQRGLLGCTVMELDSKMAKEKNITATKSGMVVSTVQDRSTAKELGLETDDVITAINGVKVANYAQLAEQMSKLRPGDRISVTYVRDNKFYTKSATLRNAQGNTTITQKTDFSNLGCAFMKASKETLSNLQLSTGVQVTGLKPGVVKDAGVKNGFIITEINGIAVSTPDDVERIFNSVIKDDESDKVMFMTGYYSTGKKAYYAVNLSEL